MTASLAIVADFDSGSRSHAATNDAVAHSAADLGVSVQPEWIGTAELAGAGGQKRLADFSGMWIGPGSPYASMEGALSAIRIARARGIPLLGTCGGFQHIILSTRETFWVSPRRSTRSPRRTLRRCLFP